MATLMGCSSCAPISSLPNTSDTPAVGRLISHNEKGVKIGTCTAWKASDDIIATAGHCCVPGRKYSLEGPFAVPGASLTGLFDAYDHTDDDAPFTSDMCFLKGKMAGQPLELADRDPVFGERVWTSGYPHGVPLVSDGHWSGRDPEDGLGIASVAANPGASGSPILNSRHQVVGILVRYRVGMDVIGYVTPIEKVRMGFTHAQNLLVIGKTDGIEIEEETDED